MELLERDSACVAMFTISFHIYPSLSSTRVLLHRYFYITKHPLYEESDREDLVAYMTEKLQNAGKVKGKVLDVELCKHKSIYFYQEHDQTYMKVIMQFPNDVTLAREVFRVLFSSTFFTPSKEPERPSLRIIGSGRKKSCSEPARSRVRSPNPTAIRTCSTTKSSKPSCPSSSDTWWITTSWGATGCS